MKQILLIPIIFLLVSACQPAETVRIGAVLPLTGDVSFWGINAQRGIELAMEDYDVEIIFEDSKCDPKTSVTAINKLLDIDNVDFIVGDICSSATLAIAPVAEESKKVMITPCSEADAISNAGDYIFRTWTPNGQQARDLAKYSKNILEIKSVGILSIHNAFGDSLSTAFIDEFVKLGGKVLTVEKYTEDSKDFRTMLTKIQAKQPEAVFLAAHGPDNIAIVRQFNELGLSSTILSAGTINTPEYVQQNQNTIYFADLEDTTTPQFIQRFEKRFKTEWPGASSCAGVAYDDISILAEAVQGVGKKSVKDHLYKMKHKGVSGSISFNSNGDLERPYSIFSLRKDKATKVQ